MATTIHSNGSRWSGRQSASVEELIEVLATQPLDRTFEAYGNFIFTPEDEAGRPLAEPGVVRFWGNFLSRSHVFCIDTDDPELIERLTAAIRANQQRPDYVAQPPYFDERKLQIVKHFLSQTQWSVELIYDGRSLGRFDDKIRLGSGGQWEGHPPRVWYDTARRILAEEHAASIAAKKEAPVDDAA